MAGLVPACQLSRCAGALFRDNTSFFEWSQSEWERKRRVKVDARSGERSGGCVLKSGIARSDAQADAPHIGTAGCDRLVVIGCSDAYRRPACPFSARIDRTRQVSRVGVFAALGLQRRRARSRKSRGSAEVSSRTRKSSSVPGRSCVGRPRLTSCTPLGRPVESKKSAGKQTRMLCAIC